MESHRTPRKLIFPEMPGSEMMRIVQISVFLTKTQSDV